MTLSEIFGLVAIVILFIFSIYVYWRADKEESAYRKKKLDYLDQILKKMR